MEIFNLDHFPSLESTLLCFFFFRAITEFHVQLDYSRRIMQFAESSAWVKRYKIELIERDFRFTDRVDEYRSSFEPRALKFTVQRMRLFTFVVHGRENKARSKKKTTNM